MQSSLDHINPHQLKSFVKKLCIISSRYKKKHQALQNLDKHVKKLGKSSGSKDSLSKLKSRIDDVLDAEKKILKQGKQGTAESGLKSKVVALEKELQKVKGERDRAVRENKKQIEDLSMSLLSIKTSLHNMIEAKKAKEKRLRDLEKRLGKKI